MKLSRPRSRSVLVFVSSSMVFLILLLSAFRVAPMSSESFIPGTGAGLWEGEEYKSLDGRSPSIIALPGGELLALSNNGKLFRILRTGRVNFVGQVSGVSVVTPASYFELNGKKYVVYSSDNGSASKIVVQDVETGEYYDGNLENSSWSGVTVTVEASKAVIFTSSIGERKGKVYRFEFVPGDGLEPVGSELIDGSSKVPLMLSSDGKELYVLNQNGKFFVLDANSLKNKDTIGSPISLSGEFITPMAMDSQKNIYLINSAGVMYVIERSQIKPGYVPKSAKVLPSANVAGILVDSYGIIYAFGAGSIVAVKNVGGKLSILAGPFVVGGIINSTPLAVLGRDNKTYLIVPSTVGATGVLTVVSFDPEKNTFTKVWERTLSGGSFTIASALTAAPTTEEAALYYFATSLSNGTIYAWKMNGKPLGDWPMYGQNRYRSNYLSFLAEEQTKIVIMAKEPLNGKFFKNPALLFWGRIYNSVAGTYTPLASYCTNPESKDPIPQATPALYELELYFEERASRQLFVPESTFVREVFGGDISQLPATDTLLSFAQWDVESIYKYPGKKDDGRNATNPATITFAYYDKRYDVIADAVYLWRIDHILPGAALSTETRFVRITYENVEKGKEFVETIPGYPNFKPFDWTVYMWDPDSPKGYVVYDKNYLRANGMITKDLELKLKKSGPAYIKIKYTTSSGSIRLIMPKYAYGLANMYILVDAAKGANAVWFTLTSDVAKGIKFNKIDKEEIADLGTMGRILEKTVESNRIKYVFGGPLYELSEDTRLATITVLTFFEKPIYFDENTNISDYIRFEEGFIQIKGVTAPPSEVEDLAPYRETIPNSLVFLLGDFNNDGRVDLNDWNLLADRYGSTVSGADVIYNIGPRDKNFSVNPYDPGALLDTANKIDQWDIAVFTQMFGMVTSKEEILSKYPFKK